MNSENSAPAPLDWPNRSSYLAEVAVLFLLAAGIETGLNKLFEPSDLRSFFVTGAIRQLTIVGLCALALLARGDRAAVIGLHKPARWGRTLFTGVCIAAVFFIFVYVIERLGYRRNLSGFAEVKGNAELTFYGILYSLVAAGFCEEFLFRGFLFHRLAMFFGASRNAWIVACILQGILFGLAHNYQNPHGVALTGGFGIAIGFVFLRRGRNLWALIIGHGLYDVARFGLFYSTGPPS